MNLLRRENRNSRRGTGPECVILDDLTYRRTDGSCGAKASDVTRTAGPKHPR